MRFTRLALENWRNFTGVTVELQNRAFLVGPNASGTAHRYTDIVLDVGLEETDGKKWRYRLAFSQGNQRQGNQRRPIVKAEQVWQDSEQVLDRPDASDLDDPERRLHTNIEQVIANPDFRAIADFFSWVRYYHIVPQLVREPDRSVGRKEDPFGGDFLEQIARADKRTQQSRLDRIKDALKVAVPQLAELKLDKDERGIPHLLGKYEHWRAQGAWQTEVNGPPVGLTRRHWPDST